MSRTGVIVGIEGATEEMAAVAMERLRDRFPGVEFAIVTGASSVAFQWDDPRGVDPAPTADEAYPDEALR